MKFHTICTNLMLANDGNSFILFLYFFHPKFFCIALINNDLDYTDTVYSSFWFNFTIVRFDRPKKSILKLEMKRSESNFISDQQILSVCWFICDVVNASINLRKNEKKEKKECCICEDVCVCYIEQRKRNQQFLLSRSYSHNNAVW